MDWFSNLITSRLALVKFPTLLAYKLSYNIDVFEAPFFVWTEPISLRAFWITFWYLWFIAPSLVRAEFISRRAYWLTWYFPVAFPGPWIILIIFRTFLMWPNNFWHTTSSLFIKIQRRFAIWWDLLDALFFKLVPCETLWTLSIWTFSTFKSWCFPPSTIRLLSTTISWCFSYITNSD